MDNSRTMERRLSAVLFLVCLFVPPAVLAHQSERDQEAELRRAEQIREARRVEENRRMLDKLTDLQFNSPPTFGRSSKGAEERAKFYETVPMFRDATSRYREAMGLEPDLRAPAKGIEKLIGPIRDYFDTMKFKREPVDLSEFQNLSTKDLLWETLTTAERVDNDLQLARRLVQQSEREGAINIRVLEFFGAIQDDLSRLKWLASKVSEGPPPRDRK